MSSEWNWLESANQVAAMFPDFGWPDRLSFSEAIAEQLTRMQRIPAAQPAQGASHKSVRGLGIWADKCSVCELPHHPESKTAPPQGREGVPELVHWTYKSGVAEAMCGAEVETGSVVGDMGVTCPLCQAAFVGYKLGRANSLPTGGENQESGEPKPKAPSHSEVAITKDSELSAANRPDVERGDLLELMTRDRDAFERELNRCAEIAQGLRRELKATQGLLNIKEAFWESAEKEADQLREALIWCGGSSDFAPEGKAREGWLKLCAPLLVDPDIQLTQSAEGSSNSSIPAIVRSESESSSAEQEAWCSGLAYAINLISEEIPVASPQGELAAAPHVKAVIAALRKAKSAPYLRNNLFTSIPEPLASQPTTSGAEARRAHYALHKLWTKAVGQDNYVKAEWRELDDAVVALGRLSTGAVDQSETGK